MARDGQAPGAQEGKAYFSLLLSPPLPAQLPNINFKGHEPIKD
jgi:hypothetical protein